jgi:hypothetical protein
VKIHLPELVWHGLAETIIKAHMVKNWRGRAGSVSRKIDTVHGGGGDQCSLLFV